uniref:Uncharacterized protein n=1 Tax=Rhizophora mucronata TaxID=61149 RepID=A0A2P2MX10_RHIMU
MLKPSSYLSIYLDAMHTTISFILAIYFCCLDGFFFFISW